MRFPQIGQGMGLYKWEKEHISVLREGVDLGLNFFDTSSSYPGSEEILSFVIDGIRDRVLIGTKFSAEDSSYNKVIESLEKSLKRLKTDYVDLFQMHWPNPDVPVEETIRAMESLIVSGKVRCIGLGNIYVKEMSEWSQFLSKHKFSTVQVEYNFFDRLVEEGLLPYCSHNGVILIAYSPLDRGRILDDQYKSSRISRIACKYNKTISQINLRWLTQNKPVMAIPKAVNKKHIIENSESVNFVLDEEDVLEIDNITKKAVEYVSTDEIQVTPDGEYNRHVYCTLQEAMENKMNYIPSPYSLSKHVCDSNAFFKPIRLLREDGESYRYKLIEGRIRYWAWVIANKDKLIPSYVRDNKVLIK